MAIIPLPDADFRSAAWELVQPARVNRLEFTGGRQVVLLPGAAYWRASAEHVPIVGEANIRKWRSFFAKLKGQANHFELPATEGKQGARGFYHLGAVTGVNDGGGVTLSSDLRDITSVGSSGWGLAYAHTTGTLANGARAMFRAGQTNANLMAGLNDSVSGAGGWSGLNAAINANDNGRLYIYESGVYRGEFGPYTADDALSVVYDLFGASWQIRYYRNSELLRILPATGGDVYRFEGQIFTAGARILDASFTSPGGITAGATSVTLRGFPASQVAAIQEGWFATALYAEGAQLVTITADANADVNGAAVATFEPMLREVPFAFLTGRPFARVAMDSPDLGYAVDPSQQYGFGFQATEAF